MDNERFQDLMLEHFGKVLNELTGMKTELTEVKQDVAGIKTELTEVKQDVAGIKTELTEVKQDVAGIKTELTEVKQDVAGLKESQGRMETDIAVVGNLRSGWSKTLVGSWIFFFTIGGRLRNSLMKKSKERLKF